MGDASPAENSEPERHLHLLANTPNETRISKLHNVDLERAVLGCAMLPESPARMEVAEMLDIAALLPIHQIVATAIRDLVKQERACDVLSVVAELQLRGQLDQVGGREAIALIGDYWAISRNVDTYIHQLHELHRRRQLLALSYTISRYLQSGVVPAVEIEALSALSRGDGDE